MLNGIAFLLIGLQLPYILAGIRSVSRHELVFGAFVVVTLVILLRLAWVFPASYFSNLVRRRILRQRRSPISHRAEFLVGWTGMRGVVSLAAALSLPEVLHDGTPFPQRNVIVFLTFCVIFVTLVLQGLTLPVLIRRLGLGHQSDQNPEEQDARRKILHAALGAIERLRVGDRPELHSIYDNVAHQYRGRLALVEEGSHAQDSTSPEDHRKYREVLEQVRAIERETAIGLRDTNQISDAVLRKLEHELDLLDVRFQTK
jgi:monovalent cation/hydrogen antiporter